MAQEKTQRWRFFSDVSLPGLRRTVVILDTFDKFDDMKLCDDDGRTDEFVPLVGDEELPGGDGSLRRIEDGFECSVFTDSDFDFLICLAVADFRLTFPGERPVLAEPLPISERKSAGEELVLLFVAHDYPVVRHVLCYHVESVSSSNPDVPALADGVKPGARMFADLLSRRVHDVSRLFGKAFAEEFPHGNLSDEAEALAVFAFGVGEPRFAGDPADFGLGNVPYWKIRFLDLRPIES